YRYVHELTSDVDVFFVGMECAGAPLSWIYGPLLTRPIARKADQSRRLDGSNFEKARDIVERFNPKQAYVYAMGQEPWMSHIVAIRYTESSLPIVESDKLVGYCRNRGIESERLTGYKEINLQ
ncbi:MAG: MBL fold metallo-hydrolase, partial [Blastocatellia bacterium]